MLPAPSRYAAGQGGARFVGGDFSPSPGTPGEGGGEGVADAFSQTAPTLALPQSTRGGDNTSIDLDSSGVDLQSSIKDLDFIDLPGISSAYRHIS